MIIRTIATALVQCSTRTQIGWIAFAGVAVSAWSSLTARLAMADFSARGRCWLIRREPAFRYRIRRHQFEVRRLSRSQKSEPGGARLAVSQVPSGTRRARQVLRRRHQHGVDDMDDAVRLADVRDRHHRGAALGVDDPDLAVLLLDGEFLALGRLQ